MPMCAGGWADRLYRRYNMFSKLDELIKKYPQVAAWLLGSVIVSSGTASLTDNYAKGVILFGILFLILVIASMLMINDHDE